MLPRLLALVRVSETKFVSAVPGQAPPGARATFGGTIVAQSLWAAIKTTASAFEPASLQCYFLVGGDPKERIVYEVDLLRDGRNFAHRQVRAYQFKKVIYVATIMLYNAEASNSAPSTDSVRHLSNVPDFPDLKQMVPAAQLFRSDVVENLNRYRNLHKSWNGIKVLDPFIERFESGAVEYRFPKDLFNSGEYHDKNQQPHLSHLDYYQRVRRPLSTSRKSDEEISDPRFQYVEFAYLTDAYLLLCLPYFHLLPLYCHKFSVSLDHTIHFHKRPSVNEWMALRVTNPRSDKSRHLVRGEYFDNNREPVASVTQEGLVVYESPSNIRARF
ncbi:LAME_0C01398g1_1 [Lachancea meyersii CBS 8951]|uniref:LAME_0C01398g1_1 n=1 Tax=Lachancea meyersii CBS 8951 TaxID=1266667 RepID=A0A1G4IZ19_9SACH|nr:LAME_0C01398g1_1 [Lachancea meyersii CBS 8951]